MLPAVTQLELSAAFSPSGSASPGSSHQLQAQNRTRRRLPLPTAADPPTCSVGARGAATRARDTVAKAADGIVSSFGKLQIK